MFYAQRPPRAPAIAAIVTAMNKSELTRRLARSTHSSEAQAADYLDLAVNSILKRTKRGEKVAWPGLGVFLRKPSRPAAKGVRRAPAKR
jgi:nucleoid DNA-binding protein